MITPQEAEYITMMVGRICQDYPNESIYVHVTRATKATQSYEDTIFRVLRTPVSTTGGQTLGVTIQ